MNLILNRPYHLVVVALLCLACLALAACGGGSSSGNPGHAPPLANKTPTVNAGANQTVAAGTRVSLEGDGTDSDGEIVERRWRQISGPEVSLSSEDSPPWFIAPHTGTEPSVVLEFSLTVTDDDGATATDSVRITVTRVNQTPVADAGPDFTVDGLMEARLVGSGADPDGEIVHYSWMQTKGTPIDNLAGADTASATFTAPATAEPLELEFTLTVTDNDGASGSDAVTVIVHPEDAPSLQLFFPPETGFYGTDPEIDVFGWVKARNGATIESLTVRVGDTSVEVLPIIDADGRWRVSLPTPGGAGGTSPFDVTVTATDTADFSRSHHSRLAKAPSSMPIGAGEAWEDTTAIAVDPGRRKAYVLTRGSGVSDVKLMPVDLRSGYRSASITNFTDASQGPTATAFTHMVYDAQRQHFYLATDTSTDPQILAVNLESGSRTLVSDNTRGSGTPFNQPAGLALGPEGTLFVADSGENAIVAVDLVSGDRTLVLDTTAMDYPLEGPQHIGWDDKEHTLLILAESEDNTYLLGFDLTVEPVSYRIISDNNDHPGEPMSADSSGILVDSSTGLAYTRNNSDGNLLGIDLNTGERHLIRKINTGIHQGQPVSLAYDPMTQLSYVALRLVTPELWVLDPQTGQDVLFSKPPDNPRL